MVGVSNRMTGRKAPPTRKLVGKPGNRGLLPQRGSKENTLKKR